MSGFLPITEQVRAGLQALAEKAARRENWYRPHDPSYAIPGEVPGGKFMAGSYSVVFTWTVDAAASSVWRHLSIRAPTGYPPPIVVFSIARWLGFTGAQHDNELVIKPAETWTIQPNDQERTIVVAEQIAGLQP
jgi:hypothetical protein